MSKNYGWGSRDMKDAGRMAMQAQMTSDATIATHAQRFGKFKEFSKENGVARFERVTTELVKEYGQSLADKVDAEEMSPAYAQNLLSSVNTVMGAATRGEWKSVSPTKECGIQQRSHVRDTATVGRENAERGVQALREQGLERQASVAQLAHELGLRSKEGSLLNAKTALAQAEARGVVSIKDGTKGGREREIRITNERQVEALKNAATAQGDGRGVMPPDNNWREWREAGLREGREALQATTGGGYHELRRNTLRSDTKRLRGIPRPAMAVKS